MAEKVAVKIQMDRSRYELLQAAMEGRGSTAEAVLESGENIEPILNDALYQALGRKLQRKEIPAELLAEAKAWAAAQAAERAQRAAAAAQMSQGAPEATP